MSKDDLRAMIGCMLLFSFVCVLFFLFSGDPDLADALHLYLTNALKGCKP